MDFSQIGNLIQQFAGGQTPPQAEVEKHFDQMAPNASQGDLASGLSQAFRSDQTPPFSQMLGTMFQNSDGTQKAGVLNSILSSLGPSVLSSVGGGALAGMLGGGGSVTPQQASQVTPEQMQEIAAHAEKQDPSVIDKVSSFYSQHPTIMKSLGAAALMFAVREVGKRNT